MAFPLPPPYWFQRECNLMERLDEILTEAGWFTVRFSARRSMPRQMKGWPDLVAFRDDETLLIEGKVQGGSVRESQREFKMSIAPHEGGHVRYVVLSDLRQLTAKDVTSGN